MIKLIGPEFAQYIAEHQEMYPEAMREDVATFERLLASGHCLGWFDESEILIAWILFEDDASRLSSSQVYCYDCAVFPEYQRKGIGKALSAAAYKELRWMGYSIRMHCRRASYPSPAFLFRYGYEIVADVFLPDHYAKEYEDDSLKGEHAHELVLKPIGQ